MGDRSIPFLPACPENYFAIILLLSVKSNNLVKIHLELSPCPILGLRRHLAHPWEVFLPDVPFESSLPPAVVSVHTVSSAGVTVCLVTLSAFSLRVAVMVRLFLVLVIPGKPDSSVCVTSNLPAGLGAGRFPRDALGPSPRCCFTVCSFPS